MWLRSLQKERGATEEPLYDAPTLRKVAALAGRLQNQKQETLTAREIEAIGAEAGLEPAFIRQALAQLAVSQPPAVREKAALKELWPPVAIFGAPLVWGALSWLLRDSPGLAPLFFFILPAPLALLLGFLSGQKKVGFVAAAELLVVMELVTASAVLEVHINQDWNDAQTREYLEEILVTLLYCTPLAGLVGLLGAALRGRYSPASSARQPVSRPALLNLLFTLQRQLEGQKQRRAFLSVDVVGSSEMKRTGPELSIEYSFGQYRAWVEELVRANGGEMQSAAGDGVMAIFSTDAGAVRTARHLQEELTGFNQTHNRLPLPFRIRCGISAGEVAMEEGTPLGHLQSSVIDRAAALQKRAAPGDIVVSSEVAGAALVELGNLAPLAEPIGGEPAFSWQAARRPDAVPP
jgi:class 3 adenylate cyclase